MIRAWYRGVLASWLLVGMGTGWVRAAAWTDALFPENRHDFGPVPRGAKVKHEFHLTHPCPSTCLTSGACPGYVKDHIVPLACGGPDAVSNMQWQTVGEGRAKDKWEAKGCARRYTIGF